ncbi:unnamed protein product, partial [Rhizoctonia solani]
MGIRPIRSIGRYPLGEAVAEKEHFLDHGRVCSGWDRILVVPPHVFDSESCIYRTNDFLRGMFRIFVAPGIPLFTLMHLRIPAAWCGLYALKPSDHRLPALGLAGSYQGKENINIAIGPLAHSARDLEMFCQVVSSYKPWNTDPSTLTIPWNPLLTEPEIDRKLVIGLLTDDGVVAPHPPIVECLHRTREALIAAGHEVIDFEPLETHPQNPLPKLPSTFGSSALFPDEDEYMARALNRREFGYVRGRGHDVESRGSGPEEGGLLGGTWAEDPGAC